MRQAILLLADGTRPDVMEHLLRRGDLPGIARTLLEPAAAGQKARGGSPAGGGSGGSPAGGGSGGGPAGGGSGGGPAGGGSGGGGSLAGGHAPAAGEAPPAASPGAIPLACTAFPSTTGPAHLPFLTGCFPGPCNVPGIRWFDPRVYARKPWSPFRFRSYMGLGNFLAASDLSRQVRTLFELIPDHACIAGNVRRGVRFTRDLTRWAKLLHNIRSFFVEEWYGMDEVAGQRLLAAARRGIPFVFAAFYAADSNGHKHGPDDERTLEAYRRIDRTVGRLGEQLRSAGRAAETLVALVSDHGLSATHGHLDLQRLVERIAGRCLAHPTIHHGLLAAEAAVMVSGNAMAHVYLKGRSRWAGEDLLLDQPGPVLDRLVHALLAEEAVDLIAGRASGDEVLVLSRRGRARIGRSAEDGSVVYHPEGSDPFDYPDRLAGTHPDRSLLEQTWSTDYPDAPAQLLQLFRSPRCGHLVISATPGHDLRARFEKPAHRGSHGSLHRLHMLTPLLLDRPRAAVAGPCRTVDVAPTLLSALGLPLPEGLDGVSLLG